MTIHSSELATNAAKVSVRNRRKPLSYALMIYVAIGVLAFVMCLTILAITKIPLLVMLGTAFSTATLYLLYARLTEGYWDKFAGIAFIVIAGYALLVSIVVLAIGRHQKLPFFVGKKAAEGKEP